jgi:acyl-CoA thioesterase-2
VEDDARRSHRYVLVRTQDVVTALQLEATGDHHYRAGHAYVGSGTASGGQLIGQSLVAAAMENDGKRLKTIHTTFPRAATSEQPIELRVESIQSGRTFASASVTISQNERICAQSLVLLTSDDEDFIHHGDVATGHSSPPSGLPDDGTWQVGFDDGVDLADPAAVGPPDLDVWVRFGGAPSDLVIDQALLAYSTDFFLIGTAMRPHAGVGQSQSHQTLSTGVITHTLTFHEAAPAAEWTLIRHHSTYAGRGRSYGRGDVFRNDGVLAASFVQDAMIRPMAQAGSGRL